MKLHGKVAIVTGASKGIGGAIAKGMAKAGANVVVNYASDRSGAEKAVAAITAAGGKAVAVKADVSKSADVKELFEQTIRTFGRLDILVNNAGVYRFEPIEAVTEEEFYRIYNTNVLGAVLNREEAIKHFAAEGGAIINIATAGVSSTLPMSSVYTSSKSALVALSSVLAKELGPRNIRVNVVAPGACQSALEWDPLS